MQQVLYCLEGVAQGVESEELFSEGVDISNIDTFPKVCARMLINVMV